MKDIKTEEVPNTPKKPLPTSLYSTNRNTIYCPVCHKESDYPTMENQTIVCGNCGTKRRVENNKLFIWNTKN